MISISNIAPHHHLAKWAGIFLLAAIPLVYAHQGHDIVLYLKLLVAQIGTLGMTAAWFIGTVQGHISNRRHLLDLPVLLFLFIHVLSWATMAINPFKSGLEVVKLLTFAILYFSVSRTYHPSFLKPWIYVITCVTALISLMGICQHLGIGFLWLRSSGYPSATFVYRNFAAMYLVMAIPLTLIPFLIAHRTHMALLWALLFACPIIFLIYTRTRGAWVGLLGGIILAWIAYAILSKRLFPAPKTTLAKTKNLIALFIVALILGAAQLPSQIPVITEISEGIPTAKKEALATLQSIFEKQDSGRSIVWKHTLKMIQDHIFLGVGLGNWEIIYPLYDRGDTLSPGFIAKRPHNDLLWTWSELGILGFFAHVSILVATALLIFRLRHSTQAMPLPACLFLIAISLLAITGHAMFSFPKERIPPLFLWYFTTGILAAYAPHQPAHFLQGIRSYVQPVFCIVAISVTLIFTNRAITIDKQYYTLTQHRLQGNWHALIKTADEALQYGVLDPWILFWKAHAVHLTGNPIQAQELFQTCLIYRPHDMTLHWKIGTLAQTNNDLNKAQTALEQAVFLDHDNPNFYQDLGAIYQNQGKLDEALEKYQQAFDRGAQDLKIHMNMGILFEMQGYPNKAKKAYEHFLKHWQGDAATAERIQKRFEQL